MTKPQQPPDPAHRYAAALFHFSQWAQDIEHNQIGVPLVGPEQREWIAAAARFIRETIERESEMRRQNSRNGKRGGRPTTDDPKPSTVRSRESRARKKATKKGRTK